MSAENRIYEKVQPDVEESGSSPVIRYRVIIEGVCSDRETLDSFAIKYGILTNTPVTRVKFLLRSLPRTLLETQSAPKARGALALIEEAGGAGLIEEFSPDEVLEEEMTEEIAEVAVSKEKASCPQCGFPIKEGDEYCQFCHTPLVEKKKKSVEIKSVLKAGEGSGLFTRKRLLICAGVVLLVLVLKLLF